MKKLAFILIIFVYGLAQAQERIVIDTINIEGLTRTKEKYLRQFIHSNSNQDLDSTLILEDIRRLSTLSSVGEAQFEVISSDSFKILKFCIEERATLLPVGDFGLTEESYWFGLGAMEANFLGRGIYLYGFYRYFDQHTYHLIFKLPYLFGSRFGLNLYLKDWASEEPIYNQGETFIYLFESFEYGAGLRYEFEYEHDIELIVMPRRERYSFLRSEFEPQEDRFEQKRLSFQLLYNKQKLNYNHFRIQGYKNRLGIEVLSAYKEQKEMLILYNEFKYYLLPFERTNLAFRNYAGISINSSGLFLPFALDSYLNMRGIGGRTLRGKDAFICNVELRQQILERKSTAIQMVVFNDVGRLFDKEGSFGDPNLSESWNYFGGFGCRLIYKPIYNAVLSIDYGMDLLNFDRGGWVIGWGYYF